MVSRVYVISYSINFYTIYLTSLNMWKGACVGGSESEFYIRLVWVTSQLLHIKASSIFKFFKIWMFQTLIIPQNVVIKYQGSCGVVSIFFWFNAVELVLVHVAMMTTASKQSYTNHTRITYWPSPLTLLAWVMVTLD